MMLQFRSSLKIYKSLALPLIFTHFEALGHQILKLVYRHFFVYLVLRNYVFVNTQVPESVVALYVCYIAAIQHFILLEQYF